MRGVAVLGATGSIGQSTLDVMQRHPERYHAVVVSANRSVDDMASICRTHKPTHAVMGEPESALALRDRLVDLPQVAVSAGADALDELLALPDIDTVVAGIVGFAGTQAYSERGSRWQDYLVGQQGSLGECWRFIHGHGQAGRRDAITCGQ